MKIIMTPPDTSVVAAALAAHLADTVDAHDASAISFVPVGTIAATDAQTAIAEVATDAAAALAAHIAATPGAHAASAIVFTPVGTIAAINAQTAIAEVATDAAADLAAHLADTTDAHAASAITNTPAGTIAATTVQAAINELNGDSVATDAALAAHIAATPGAHNATAILLSSTVVAAVNAKTGIEEAATFNVPANTTVAAAGTYTPPNFRKILQGIAGNAAPTTMGTLSNANAQTGDMLILIGTDATNTHTITAATTNVIVNGSAVLGLDDMITFIYFAAKWREVSRSA